MASDAVREQGKVRYRIGGMKGSLLVFCNSRLIEKEYLFIIKLSMFQGVDCVF
jgi:hypothetical protein